LRELAPDYGVAHTTLGRYFTRPEITSELQQSRRLVRRERRAAAERRAAERRMEREVRRQAKEQVALEDRLRAARAVRAAGAAARGRRRSASAAWLDERDARLPLSRADLHSRNDELAAETVAGGAGMQAVIEATGLRTRENVLRLIDPVILVQALDNDTAAMAVAGPVRDRLRRLVTDPELLRRRAAGDSLRVLAVDYGVAHTTLYRYFQRPEVARHLRQATRVVAARRRA